MKIYHNPRCTKSRETLAILNKKGVEVEVVEYLKNTPSIAELEEIVNKLGISAEQLLRKGEALFKENYKGTNLSNDQWIEIMVKNPILIERPIVVLNDRAIIGRPPENVNDLL